MDAMSKHSEVPPYWSDPGGVGPRKTEYAREAKRGDWCRAMGQSKQMQCVSKLRAFE